MEYSLIFTKLDWMKQTIYFLFINTILNMRCEYYASPNASDLPSYHKLTILTPESGAELDPLHPASFRILFQTGFVGHRIRCTLACRSIQSDRRSLRERTWELELEGDQGYSIPSQNVSAIDLIVSSNASFAVAALADLAACRSTPHDPASPEQRDILVPDDANSSSSTADWAHALRGCPPAEPAASVLASFVLLPATGAAAAAAAAGTEGACAWGEYRWRGGGGGGGGAGSVPARQIALEVISLFRGRSGGIAAALPCSMACAACCCCLRL